MKQSFLYVHLALKPGGMWAISDYSTTSPTQG